MATTKTHPPKFPIPAFVDHRPGSWVTRGVCRNRWAVMDADTDQGREIARKICMRCPVMAECRAWSLDLPDRAPVHGVVAGLTAAERTRARKRRAA